MITKEKVLEEAKKLGITVTDAQVETFVSLGVLPTKGPDSASGNTDDDPDDDDDPDESGNLTDSMKKRLAKEREKRQKIKKERDELNQKLLEAQQKREESDRTEAEKKGEYTKLLDETGKKKASYEQGIVKTKETVRRKAVEGEIKVALLASGVPADRLPKAIRLFDVDKVDFDWTDEENLEFEISGVSELVESFKKDNEFLYDSNSSQSNSNGNFQPIQRPNKTGKPSTEEERKAALEKKFPALRSLV